MIHPPPLHAWFHCYATGNWQQPVTDYCDALTRFGLYDELASHHVGFVGRPDEIAAARASLDVLVLGYEVCAESPEGWEQETLEPMWKFCHDHDGLVLYTHTKGASRADPVDQPWRRSMLYHNVVNWQEPVTALTEGGKSIAGCHWYCGGPSSIPGYGTGGMFGGNFWWTRCDLLRQNVPPDNSARGCAEHWIGQLSEVMPLTPDTIHDLNPGEVGSFHDQW